MVEQVRFGNGELSCEQCPVVKGPDVMAELGCVALQRLTNERGIPVLNCANATTIAEDAPSVTRKFGEEKTGEACWQPLKRPRNRYL